MAGKKKTKSCDRQLGGDYGMSTPAEEDLDAEQRTEIIIPSYRPIERKITRK